MTMSTHSSSDRIGHALTKLKLCGVAIDDPRMTMLTELLSHSLAAPPTSGPRSLVQSKPHSAVSPRQRVQLITQVHTLRYFLQHPPPSRMELPVLLQQALYPFVARVPVSISVAAGFAARITHVSNYLLEILEKQYNPSPLPYSIIVQERDASVRNLVDSMSQHATTEEHALKLKLIKLQSQVRNEVCGNTTWKRVMGQLKQRVKPQFIVRRSKHLLLTLIRIHSYLRISKLRLLKQHL